MQFYIYANVGGHRSTTHNVTKVHIYFWNLDDTTKIFFNTFLNIIHTCYEYVKANNVF